MFLSSVGMLSCRGCPILWMIPCCLFEPPPSRYNFLKIQSMLFFLMLLSLWILLFTPRSGSLHVLLVLRGLILPTAATPSTSSSSQFLCETPQRPLDSLLGPPQGLGGGGGHGTNVGILGGVSMGHICATSVPPPPAPWVYWLSGLVSPRTLFSYSFSSAFLCPLAALVRSLMP